MAELLLLSTLMRAFPPALSCLLLHLNAPVLRTFFGWWVDLPSRFDLKRLETRSRSSLPEPPGFLIARMKQTARVACFFLTRAQYEQDLNRRRNFSARGRIRIVSVVLSAATHILQVFLFLPYRPYCGAMNDEPPALESLHNLLTTLYIRLEKRGIFLTCFNLFPHHASGTINK